MPKPTRLSKFFASTRPQESVPVKAHFQLDTVAGIRRASAKLASLLMLLFALAGPANTKAQDSRVTIVPPFVGDHSETFEATRGFVQTGNNVMIAGVIVHGPGSKSVLIPALGPTLGQVSFNLPNSLPDPFLDLRGWQRDAYYL